MKKIALIGGTKKFRLFLSAITDSIVSTSVEEAVSSDKFDGMIFLPDYEGGKDYTVPQIIPVDINNHNVGAEIDQFVDALLKGEEVPISSIEGASTVAVCAASVESARIGKPVEIRYPVK